MNNEIDLIIQDITDIGKAVDCISFFARRSVLDDVTRDSLLYLVESIEESKKNIESHINAIKDLEGRLF